MKAVRGGSASSRQRQLGQNFLVDRNILGVIERLARLTPDDVVLEVGGGPGALSARLAARAARVHVVEVDERLRPRLQAAVAPFENVSLWFADAARFDFAALEPAPAKMVANLPYGVAATVILRTIEQLPSLREWVVMVQREVGERFAAAPGTPAYGVPSVLAQLACEVTVLRRVSRTVFRPVPNVDSVLLGLRRIGPAPDPALARLVHRAFAHRRKALAGSLSRSAGTGPGAGTGTGPGAGADLREAARAALVELGHPADERAERLSAAEFRALSSLIT